MNNTVSIILPVKDEPHLPQIVEYLNLYLPTTPHEILIITSDKSKSNYVPELLSQRNPTNIKVFKSYGDSLERAILLGFSVAQYDKIIVMDADGSHPPELIPQIIQKLDDYEMVIASRFCSGGGYTISPFRFLVTAIFNQYAKLLGSNSTDSMSGYFGIQSQLLTKMKFKPYKWKTALEINNKLRPKTIEIPFTFHNRKEGKSKSNWKIGLKILWDTLEEAL